MMNRKKVFWIALIVIAITVITSCGQKYDPESDFKTELMDRNSVMITEYVGDKETVRIPPRMQKLPITAIGEYAFASNELISVVISNNVTEIGEYAFAGNELISVVIPNSVTTIGNGAFFVNELTSVTIGNNVTEIGSYAFDGNKLTSITIPNRVIKIGENAFTDNELTSVTIGANVQLIDEAIGEGFEKAYDNSGKRAGTYTRPDTSSDMWTRKD